MIISSIHIDGFGVFCNQSLPELGPGLILIHGDNESGKSTLLGFIRTILFGFPRANSIDPNYPPLAGGNHGGRIGLMARTGEEFIVERRPGKGGGIVSVVGDKDSGSNELLQQLLGGVTYEVFKNIYAFSLSELQTIDTLRSEGIKSVIYGAAAGTAILALPKANKKIKDSLEKFFRPGGSKGDINKKIIELEDIQSEWRKASKGLSEYEQTCFDLDQIEETIKEFSHDSALIRSETMKLISYEKAWPEWILLQDDEIALQNLKEVVKSFPENGISRLDKELDAIESHKNRLVEYKNSLKKRRKESEALIVDNLLLSHTQAIGLLLEKKSEYTEKVKSLPLAQQEKRTLNSEIQKLISSLGPDWSEQAVLGIDRSLFTREAIRKQEQKINDQDRQLAAADKISGDRKEQYEVSVRVEAHAKDIFEQFDDLGPEINEQLVLKLQHGRNEFANAIHDIPKRKTELEQERKQLERLIKEINPDWSPNHIRDFDNSIAAQKKVSGYVSRLMEARDALGNAEKGYSAIENSLNKTRKKHEAAILKLENVPEPSVLSEEELSRQKSSVVALERDLIRRENLTGEIRHQEERLSDKGEELKRMKVPAFFSWATWICAVLGLLVVLGIFLFDLPFVAGTGILFIIALVFIFLKVQRRNIVKHDLTVKQQIHGIQTTLTPIHKQASELESKIDSHSNELKLAEFVTLDTLEIIKSRIEKDIQAYENRNRIYEEAGVIEAEVNQIEEDLKHAKSEVEVCKEGFLALKNDWAAHLKKLNLSEELTPDLVMVVFSKIETGRQLLGSINGFENRIREMEKLHKGYLDLARKVPPLSKFCEDSGHELLSEVDAFFSRNRERQKLREDKRLAQQSLEEKRKIKSDARTALKDAIGTRDMIAAEKAKVIDNWQAWLTERGLPADLSPQTALEAFDTIDDSIEKINKRDQTQILIEDIDREISNYKESIAETMISLGRPMPDTEKISIAVDGLVSELDNSKGNLREKESIKRQIKAIEIELKSLNEQISKCQERTKGLLKEGSANSEDEFREREHLFSERVRLLQEIARAEKTMQHITGATKPADLKEILKEHTLEGIQTSANELSIKAENINHDLEDLRNRRAELKQSIDAMKSSDDVTKLRAEEEQLLAEIDSLSMDWARYAMAKYFIDRAKEKFEKEQQPKVIRDAGAFFQKITNSSYTGLTAPIGEDAIDVITSDKERKKTDELSRGTAEQLYLSIRFGYIRNRTQSGVPLPVIMDDILVNFDPVRAQHAVESILELSEEQQILFFTCHPDTVAIFRSIEKDVPVIGLKGGQIVRLIQQ